MAELPDLATRLAEIKRGYIADLPAKAAQLEVVWQAVQSGHWAAESVSDLHRIAHTLAGSAATFGLDQLSRTARALEAPLAGLADDATARNAAGTRDAVAERVAALLVELRTAARTAPS